MIVRHPDDQVATLGVREGRDFPQQLFLVIVLIEVKELFILDFLALLDTVVNQLLYIVENDLLQRFLDDHLWGER